MHQPSCVHGILGYDDKTIVVQHIAIQIVRSTRLATRSIASGALFMYGNIDLKRSDHDYLIGWKKSLQPMLY